MDLIAYRTENVPAVIRPATVGRDWMDETPNRFAYRCLPLTIANQHGWELLCPSSFDVLWTGGTDPSSLELVQFEDGDGLLPLTHFGSGVLTFKPGYLFRSEGPYNLFVGGPPNTRKDGIAPLTGIIEASWLPFTFTMNWIITRPGVVIRFRRGEPFCFLFPIARHLVEEVNPIIRELGDDPELHEQYQEWRELRAAYRHDVARDGSPRNARGREPFYARGTLASGAPVAGEHQTRLRVKPFCREQAADGGAFDASHRPSAE